MVRGLHIFHGILWYAGAWGGLCGMVGRPEDNEEQFEEDSGDDCGRRVGGS